MSNEMKDWLEEHKEDDSRFKICEEIELKKFNEGYKFARNNLGPFKLIHLDENDDNAYIGYLGDVSNSIDSYGELLDYRMPEPVVDNGLNYICPLCDRTVVDTDHFCSYCGQRLDFKNVKEHLHVNKEK